MMMSENEDKTASSMAMVEKKPQRPVGGCVGIFFQLFNWNRSFSKKKLFSNKLLPPAHPHQSSRKFGGDERLPKNRLIANENSGGFPNMKKKESSTKQKPQMRSPSLVARLMGLESMPAVQKNKSIKETPSIFHSSNNEGNRFTSPQKGFDSNLVKEKVKNELRPQKLQKTGQSERQVLAKFTSEAFQFKSVLSRSKKHHRSKLVSPLKSPKLSSGRTSSSRLFDVATRFLEPGLQNTNRARNAITYSSTVNNTLENRNDFVMERKMEKPDILINSEMSIKSHSCKHCGSHLELNLEEKALPFSSSPPKYLNPNVEETKRNPIGPPLSSFEQEKWRVNEKYQEISTPFTAQASREGQSRNLTSRHYKPQRDSQPCIGPKHKPHRQSQVSMVRDRAPNRSNRPSSAANSVNHSKDFGFKTPTKINNASRYEENSSCNKRGGPLSPVRKRRSTGTSQNGENNSSFSGSTFARQKNTRCNSVGEREIRSDSRSFSSTNHGIGRYKEKYETNNLNSFEINPMESGNTPNKTREISFSGERDAKTNAEKLLALSGDELGAILQQKLRELSCQEEDDELARDGSEPKRTTSVILQELISALSTEKQMIYNGVDVESMDKVLSHSPHLSNKKFTFEAKQKTTARCSPGYLQLYEGEHLSPGSVLEASFSNDSCLSSTFGDGSAPNLVADSSEFYFDGLPKLEPEAEIFDSSASLKKGYSNIRLLIDLISHVFDVLLGLGFANTGLKRTKLAYAKDVILNMELVSKNATHSLSLGYFLIYELENLGRAMWADFGYLLGFKEKKHESQFKEFVLDCVIEYLDTRYGRYSSCGFVQWTKMSLSSNADEFVAELFKEVKWWMSFAEYSLDEIIDFEMSHSYGKWNDFEIEAYETGAEIGKDVLQILVDEIVVDLFEGKKSSERI